MSILSSIWKTFNKIFGGGTKATSHVTDLTGKTWLEVQYALDKGFRVANTRWAKTEWLYKIDWQIMHHSKFAGDTPYTVSDWTENGSGNTWCILPK